MTPSSGSSVSLTIGPRKLSASYILNGEKKILKSGTNKTFIPAYISFVTDAVRIGEGAQADLEKYPKHVVYDVLKLIGKGYNQVEQDKAWQFELEKCKTSSNFDVIFETSEGRRAANPVILLGLLLKCLIQLVEKELGKSIEQARIEYGGTKSSEIEEAIEVAAFMAGFRARF